jgi:hypothetical protein
MATECVDSADTGHALRSPADRFSRLAGSWR